MSSKNDNFENFRLLLMQDLLPVSVAIFDRARTGGASKVIDVFTSSEDPLQELRTEGGAGANSIRDQLDEVLPGLGHPGRTVDIEHTDLAEDIHVTSQQDEPPADEELKNLLLVLNRIEGRVDELNLYFPEDTEN